MNLNDVYETMEKLQQESLETTGLNVLYDQLSYIIELIDDDSRGETPVPLPLDSDRIYCIQSDVVMVALQRVGRYEEYDALVQQTVEQT